MQQQVHRGEASGAVDEFDAVRERVLQVVPLVGRHLVDIRGGVLVGDEEEAARAAGWVGDAVVDSWVDDVDDGLDEGAGREVLPGARALVARALGEEAFVGVAVDVGARLRPVLLADEIDDEAAQLRGVGDAVLRLAEDGADDALFACEAVEDARVLEFEIVAGGLHESIPRVLLGDDSLGLEWALGAFVGHLEEEQVGELFGVLDDADAVVAQDVTVRPEFVDELPCGGHASPWLMERAFLPSRNESIRLPYGSRGRDGAAP